MLSYLIINGWPNDGLGLPHYTYTKTPAAGSSTAMIQKSRDSRYQVKDVLELW